jgi:hypothetical protein
LKRIIIPILLLCIIGCSSGDEKEKTVKRWHNKKVDLSMDFKAFYKGKELENYQYKLETNKSKFLSYIDASCHECVDDLFELESFLKKICDKDIEEIVVIGGIEYLTLLDPENELTQFDYPIFFDFNNEFYLRNEIPDGSLFRSFLLDQNNRVIIIGNPTKSPELDNLYLDWISNHL